jgi:hypothetical protein
VVPPPPVPPVPPPLLEAAFTIKLIAAEVLAPGFGLITVTAYVPAVLCVVVAVNSVALTKVVFNAA